MDLWTTYLWITLIYLGLFVDLCPPALFESIPTIEIRSHTGSKSENWHLQSRHWSGGRSCCGHGCLRVAYLNAVLADVPLATQGASPFFSGLSVLRSPAESLELVVG